jgi:ABC-type nickel/cobalt efflux system permease component RcnA
VPSHPYRVVHSTASEAPGFADSAQFEERCLGLVLLIAGVIGIVIGWEAPREHGTELALGALFAGLGAWTLYRSWRREDDDASR